MQDTSELSIREVLRQKRRREASRARAEGLRSFLQGCAEFAVLAFVLAVIFYGFGSISG